MKIWCLFSIENEYDQPDNNLVGWFQDKPSIEKLSKYLCCPLDKSSDDTIVRLIEVWKGNSVQLHGPGTTSYRLEEIEEAKP